MIKYFYLKNKKKPIIYEEIYSTNQTNFNLYHHLFSIEKDKIGKEKEQNHILKIFYLSLIKYNLKVYNDGNSTINLILLDLLIKKKKSHFLTQYNEMKITLNQNPLLNRYYNINESKIRLNKLEIYYKHYFKFLAKPTLNNMKFNLLTHENGYQKAHLYINKVYGQKRKDLESIQNEGKGEIIFNTSIKDSIENYSTTITCDSNEQLIYPSEIYKKCKEYNKSIKCNNNKKIILTKKSSYNSIFSESINYNKSILLINDDIDDCESLVNIIKGLKNKKNDEKENRIENKIKISELKKGYVKSSINKFNKGYFQKIFSINNYRNSLTNTETKNIKEKKKVNKSQTLIHNNKMQNIKINNINTHTKLVSNIIPKNFINKNTIFNYNVNKEQNTRKKNLSLNHIFLYRNSGRNNNIIVESNKFIRTNEKNPTLKNLKHKRLYNASNLKEQINQLNKNNKNLGKKNFFSMLNKYYK